MLLPTAELQQAILIAEKLRQYIATLEIDEVEHVFVSIGVSEVLEGSTLENTIKRADEALYLAKESGRNCVKSEREVANSV